MSDPVEHRHVWRLLDLARGLLAEQDPDVVLEQVLQAAREATGARYAALGVLNEQRTELERFHTAGIDLTTQRAISEPPRGRGVLGLLITEPRPLRLTDLSQHPSSYGFPRAHPPMNSFLGVPVMINGEAWGNLYLAEKDTGEFTQVDQQAAIILADCAAATIAHSHQARQQAAQHGNG